MGTTLDTFRRARRNGNNYYALTTRGEELPARWLTDGFAENGIDYAPSTIVVDPVLHLGCFSYLHPETKELLYMTLITPESVQDCCVDISGGVSPKGFGAVGSRSTMSEDLVKDINRDPQKYSEGKNFFIVEMQANDWSMPSIFVIVSVQEPFGIGFVHTREKRKTSEEESEGDKRPRAMEEIVE